MPPIPRTSDPSIRVSTPSSVVEITTLRTKRPAQYRTDIAGVVAGAQTIRRRIRELGREIQSGLDGKEWTAVALLKGSVMFAADLLRQIHGPLCIDFMGVSSYGTGTEPGTLKHTHPLRLDVRDRSVLIVDDILDTGHTLASVTEQIQSMGARRVRTCVLLDKPARRAVQFQADHVGFRIPDWFVVGYGLDFAEHYRNLPFIGVLRPEVVARDPAKVSP